MGKREKCAKSKQNFEKSSKFPKMAFSLHFATKIVTNTPQKHHDQRTTNVTN